MRSLFNHCTKLEVVDLSSFDTSQVTNFQWMFDECTSLKYLDLSNFNTTKITNVYSMFGNCYSLIYLNLRSFKLDLNINTTKFFRAIESNNIKCCNSYNNTRTILLDNGKNPDCIDPCFNESNKKVDIINKTCIES